MNRKTGILIGILFAIGFLAFMTWNMLSLRRNRVEVCIEWNGRTECKVAAGATEQEAIRTATENACALISGGMTDSMNCSHATPNSIKRLD